MRTVQVFVVLVSAFAAVRCHPSSPTQGTNHGTAREGRSHFQVFGNGTSTPSPEIVTQTEVLELEDFGFNVPQVFQAFLNDTPEVENETEDPDPSIFGFNTPVVIQLLSNDTANSTADADIERSDDTSVIDRAYRSLSSNDDFIDDDGDDKDDEDDSDDDDDKAISVVEDNQSGDLAVPANEENVQNSSVTSKL